MAAERKFVAENVRRVLLKEYLMKEVSRAGFGGLDIQRTPMGTRVILTTERPGLVIGRRGQTIKNLTQVIEERYGFPNPQIEVQEVQNASLNAQIMAEKLAFSLERGWHFRRAGHSTVRRVMDAGARGCHIIIAGKLTGQRKRTEKFKEGYIKFCGEPKTLFIERGYAVAQLKMGIIGVTVEIMRPDAKLPADTNILNKTEAAAKLPDLFGGMAPEPVPEPVAESAPESAEQRPQRVLREQKPRSQKPRQRSPNSQKPREQRPPKAPKAKKEGE
ncbi:30S ribosomal protein S3 [Candidatus Methanoplasma termitum]|uniref:Small ribosomal subunit protein uS3 n=1 Tax=Candidatus Methanoplasma termitum TaxID=1577791 RepID=A0A0A7LH32_9ARCH|nr:30S ribosomal protein S3 [Candidatus Methanoplasma termitum]AIZ56831.1 30S ribosomal protein S3 [Candidatus Methanoplasma termitum]MCL2334285.1 30S ribosomal protein S3 [Candidatus Methanoplasma sp.]